MSEQRFSQYEFTGILIPGATLVFSYLVCSGQTDLTKAMESVSIGGLGVFSVLCYVVGHLIQAFGNLIVAAWWFIRGMPTSWLVKEHSPLLAPAQRDRVIAAFVSLGLVSDKDSLEQLKRWEWEALSAEVYARVAAADRQQRVDVFNGSFGLHRGLVSALALAIGIAIAIASDSRLSWFFGIALILAFIRMNRFSRHYARELYVQFLTTLDSKPTAKAKTKASSSGETDAD